MLPWDLLGYSVVGKTGDNFTCFSSAVFQDHALANLFDDSYNNMQYVLLLWIVGMDTVWKCYSRELYSTFFKDH